MDAELNYVSLFINLFRGYTYVYIILIILINKNFEELKTNRKIEKKTFFLFLLFDGKKKIESFETRSQ